MRCDPPLRPFMFCFQGAASSPNSPRRFANQGMVYLSEIETLDDLNELSTKQVKELLAMNRLVELSSIVISLVFWQLLSDINSSVVRILDVIMAFYIKKLFVCQVKTWLRFKYLKRRCQESFSLFAKYLPPYPSYLHKKLRPTSHNSIYYMGCYLYNLFLRVNFKGCVEKDELLKIVERLWKQEQRNKSNIESMDDDSMCKICMDSPVS